MTHFKTPVAEYMSSPVRSLRPDAPIADADKILREYALSSLAVVDAHHRPVGVITRTDLLRIGTVGTPRSARSQALTLPDRKVADVMKSGILMVAEDATLHDAAQIMVREHVHRVFVGDATKLTGVLSTKDVMRAVTDRKVPSPIANFMSSPVLTVRALETVGHATDKLRDAHVAGLVVIDDEDWPVGLYTQVEALQAREMPTSTPVEDVMNYGLLCMSTKTAVYRAAAQAIATRVRRVIAVDGRKVFGILTGIDFARVAT